MKQLLKKFFFWCALPLCFVQCEWEGYQEVEAIDLEEVDYTEDIDREPSRYELIRLANTEHAFADLPDSTAWWGYEHGLTWLDDYSYRDSAFLNVALDKFEQKVRIHIATDVSFYGDFPTVYNSSFHEKEEADYLGINLTIRNNRNNKKIRFKDDQSIYSGGSTSFNAYIYPDDLKDIPAGLTEFTVDFETEFMSFFDVRSGKKPLRGKFKFWYEVPQIHHTVLYFKSLKLNEETTMEMLGAGNDMSNSDPETGIYITCNGQTALYEFSANSFQYKHKHKVNIYHASKNDRIDINILDVDYGFNANDLIRDSLVYLKDLEGTDYYDLKMKYVDELLIYCQYKGKAN